MFQNQPNSDLFAMDMNVNLKYELFLPICIRPEEFLLSSNKKHPFDEVINTAFDIFNVNEYDQNLMYNKTLYDENEKLEPPILLSDPQKKLDVPNVKQFMELNSGLDSDLKEQQFIKMKAGNITNKGIEMSKNLKKKPLMKDTAKTRQNDYIQSSKKAAV